MITEFKINYLRPAIGTRLVATAQALSSGKRMAVCQCEFHAVDGEHKKLRALAQGTVVLAA